MGYIAETDLKKTKALSKQFESDPEVIVTGNGKPMAIKEALRLGVTRQSSIKVWLADRLEEVHQ